jgi:acyl-homoserine-lactone acylase
LTGSAHAPSRSPGPSFETNLAQSVRERHEVQTRNQGVPWVNTMAAGSTGEAYYADISVAPIVSDDKVPSCPTPLGLVTFVALGLPVLDGSRSECGWDTDDDGVARQGSSGRRTSPTCSATTSCTTATTATG